MNRKERLSRPAGTSSAYPPFASVSVDTSVPTTRTRTPARGLFVPASCTWPVTCVDRCADAGPAAASAEIAARRRTLAPGRWSRFILMLMWILLGRGNALCLRGSGGRRRAGGDEREASRSRGGCRAGGAAGPDIVQADRACPAGTGLSRNPDPALGRRPPAAATASPTGPSTSRPLTRRALAGLLSATIGNAPAAVKRCMQRSPRGG